MRLLGNVAELDHCHGPAADVNLLKVPENEPDEKWLFLSDILPTAWHANVLADTGDGDVVAVWGAGPGAASRLQIKSHSLMRNLSYMPPRVLTLPVRWRTLLAAVSWPAGVLVQVHHAGSHGLSALADVAS